MALKLGEAFALIGLRTGPFDVGMKRVQTSFKSGIASMEKVAAKAKIGLLLATGGFVLAVKAAASFEQAMARVAALTGATGPEFDALSEKARELGRTTVFSARQSAEAMSYFALAGFDANKILASMAPTLNLAAAGQLDVARASDIVAKIMAGMKLEAGELAHTVDVLTKAFTTSNTDLVQLGEAMRHVGPVGKASGKDIEELVAAVQVMSNAGIQGAAAGMALRNILIRLQAAPSEVRKALAKLGVEIADESGKMKHLGDIIDEVKAGLDKYTMTEQQAIIVALAGTRAMAAFSSMMAEGGDAIREMEKRLEGAAGTAQRIAAIQLNTFQGQLIKLKSAVEGLAIAFGEQVLPALKKITERITAWTSMLGGASEGAFETAAAVAELALKLGVLLVVLPQVMKLMSSLVMLTAVGGPLALGLTAVAAGLSMIALAHAEAAVTGKTFGDVLYDNIKLLAGLRDELDKHEKINKRIERSRKEAREAKLARAYGGEEFRGTPEDVAFAMKAIKEAEAAKEGAAHRMAALEADLAKLGQIRLGRGGFKEAEKIFLRYTKEGIAGWLEKKTGTPLNVAAFDLTGMISETQRRIRKKMGGPQMELRVARLTKEGEEHYLREVAPKYLGRQILGMLPESVQAAIRQGAPTPSLRERLGAAAGRIYPGMMGAAAAVPGIPGRIQEQRERRKATKAQVEEFVAGLRRAQSKAAGLLWLGRERWRAMGAIRDTERRTEEAREQVARGRRTPEFTAIADFAKSIQSRIYDKKQVDLQEKQLEQLKKQREIQENRLKSIDEALKKGIVRAQ